MKYLNVLNNNYRCHQPFKFYSLCRKYFQIFNIQNWTAFTYNQQIIQSSKDSKIPIFEKSMQQYEQFWHNKLSHLDSQLQLDFDTFINVFTSQIRNQTSIQLTDIQKLIIKKEIDPQNQNQVYKNGYLLFIKNFWGVASNRTKFFNLKVNLSKLKGQTDPLPMIGEIKIKISYFGEQNDYETEQKTKDKIVDEYLIKNDKIFLISNPHPLLQNVKKQQQLQMKGFIKIGSSSNNNIVIPKNQVNPEHMKIIYSTNMQQLGKSTASFIVKPIPVNQVFVRDLSSSNKLIYVADNQHKLILIKNGMVITGFGLIFGMFQMYVEGVAPVQSQQINALLESLNANRKSFFIGQPDKPQKVCPNLNMEQLSESQIADWLERNLYYPPPPQKPSSSSAPLQLSQNSSDKEKTKPTLKLRLVNKRTLQQTKYDSKNLKYVVVGRDPNKCNFIIDHISIRNIQFGFECLNDIWVLRGRQAVIAKVQGEVGLGKGEIGMAGVGVLLGKDQKRCSNRQILGTAYPEKFRIKDKVQIQITVIDREQKNEDDY